jgi:hypothetical protein
MSQERDYLTRAADAYRQALTLYAKAAGFAGVSNSIRATQRALDQIERRLADVSQTPIGAEPVPAAEARPWL